jgi:hypothetical protein
MFALSRNGCTTPNLNPCLVRPIVRAPLARTAHHESVQRAHQFTRLSLRIGGATCYVFPAALSFRFRRRFNEPR